MRSNTASQPTSRRSALVTYAALIAGVILLTANMMFMRPPRDIDYSRTRMSEAGIYRGTIRPPGDPIPQGRLHSWALHLETASGTPVDSASITVDGGMPQHGHGLPTKPVVTRHPGNGDHVVDGMKFNMGGWWVVKFRVSSSAGTDSLVFNIKL
jgi:hypothetical protein